MTVDGLDQGAGRLAAGSQIRVEVAGRADVPSDAKAVIANDDLLVTRAAPQAAHDDGVRAGAQAG